MHILRTIAVSLETRYQDVVFPSIDHGPSLIVIGAQKCGTTSLYQYLDAHPAMLMGNDGHSTEMHYFDSRYPNDTWYRSRFRAARWRKRRIQATGEVTPSYCFLPGVIRRIHEYDNRVKLIMLVRNPIDRAVSQYWMSFQGGKETLPMRAAFAAEAARTAPNDLQLRLNSYLSRGRYVEQLEAIHRYFPHEQVLIRRTEDLAAEPAATMRTITDFIGVEPLRLRDFPHYRTGSYPPIEDGIRAELQEYFAPLNKALTDRYGICTDDWN